MKDCLYCCTNDWVYYGVYKFIGRYKRCKPREKEGEGGGGGTVREKERERERGENSVTNKQF